MYSVYKHVNRMNNKVYIGITKQSPTVRWGTNGSNYKSSPHFYLAIQKYGWNTFDHIICFENLSEKEAGEKEKQLIALYQADNPLYGYNLTSGGEKAFKMSEITCVKKSLAMRGNKNGCHPCSEETKKKIAEAEKGRVFTEEHKLKLKLSAKNRKSPPCSQNKKEKLKNSNPKMRKIYCLENNTIYKSIHECARQLKLSATNICAVCKGKHSTHKKYHFSYTDNI